MNFTFIILNTYKKHYLTYQKISLPPLYVVEYYDSVIKPKLEAYGLIQFAVLTKLLPIFPAATFYKHVYFFFKLLVKIVYYLKITLDNTLFIFIRVVK